MLSHFFPNTFPGGFLGVDLFFVISGYIITKGLLAESHRTGTVSLARFYGRRIRRLWPALWLLVAVVVALGLALGPAWKPGLTAGKQALDGIYALTSSMNVVRAFHLAGGGESYLGHSWSLAAEEQFYLLWPVCLAAGLRGRSRDHLPTILLAGIVLVTIWRCRIGWNAVSVPAVQRVYFGLDTRADTLLAGCLLALKGTGAMPRRILRLWPVPAAMLAVMTLGVQLNSPMMPRGGYSMILLCSVWLVAASVEHDGLAHLLSAGPMRWAGLRSYSLYLWHVPILGLVTMLHLRLRYEGLLALALTLPVAELSYRFVERRFARIRPTARGTCVAA